ncbi:MAG: hypothetical protein JWM57_358 [Phycisphaerales bacterium]|nr:hypothetical protein [Phycisphaerales bacterium]
MNAQRLILLLALLGGCREVPPEVPRVPASSVTGNGSVRGVVHFDGTPPPRATVRNEPCCPGAPPTQLEDTVIVGPAGGLANTFVFIENGPATEGSALPAPVLDQKFCQYTPHVIGVIVRQPLKLRSSDATMHNVAISGPDGAQNFAMKAAGETASTVFTQPGFSNTKCDVHPWMAAVIGVFDNSFFAATGEDGAFEIKGIPDGTYTLVARHERYGALRQPLVIKDGQAATVDFRYHPPTP